MSATTCPLCGVTNSHSECIQGNLGDRVQCRCRYCGAWWNVLATDLDSVHDCYDELDERGLED